jgi:hypothetical protein
MSYRVIWRPKAEQELTHIWLNSRFRSHVTEAASLDRNSVVDAVHEARRLLPFAVPVNTDH